MYLGSVLFICVQYLYTCAIIAHYYIYAILDVYTITS